MAEAHPVGFRWVMKAQGARREDHPRRPALRPHERDGRPARADPRRHGHRVPRRADPPRARDARPTSRSTSSTTRTPRRWSTRTSRTPRTSAASSAASTRRPGMYDRAHVDVRGRRDRRRRPGVREHSAQSFEERTGAGMTTGRGRARRDAAAPALRASRSSSATSPATRRRWSSGSAASRGRTSCASPTRSIANSGRERTTMLVLRRRLDAAHRRACR